MCGQLYPVSFVEEGLDIDYAQIARPNGSLTTVLLPPRFRQRRGLRSAVVIDAPDRARFPRFPTRAKRWDCPLLPRSCVYIPFLWWHELRSRPGDENVAFNLFLAPTHAAARDEFDNEIEALRESMDHLRRTAPARARKDEL